MKLLIYFQIIVFIIIYHYNIVSYIIVILYNMRFHFKLCCSLYFLQTVPYAYEIFIYIDVSLVIDKSYLLDLSYEAPF